MARPTLGDVREVTIPTNGEAVFGDLTVPLGAQGLVIFAHGSGSSRHSSRNQYVAEELNRESLATLLLDLLTPDEDRVDTLTRECRFDIPMLAARVVDAIRWTREQPEVRHLPIGLFGASTGAAAALIAAAECPQDVLAVVSRGGRPDLGGDALPRVRAPTLLIVGGEDTPVIELNERAMRAMRGTVRLQIVPGATHLFEEPGTLEEAARLARSWLEGHLMSVEEPVARR